jgi:hypothetical protein
MLISVIKRKISGENMHRTFFRLCWKSYIERPKIDEFLGATLDE